VLSKLYYGFSPVTFSESAQALTVAYFFGLFFFACICLIPWIVRDSYYGNLLDSEAINKPWWAIFTTGSVFANVGIPLVNYFSNQDRVRLNPRWLDIVSTSSLPAPRLRVHDRRRVISHIT